MNYEFDTIDIIMEKMFDIIEYIYLNYYSSEEEKYKVNIELGNLYTIYEDEGDENIENDYVIVQKCDKSYI